MLESPIKHLAQREREREREREILVIFHFLKFKGIITIATLVLTIMTTSMFDYQIIKLLKSIVNVNKFDYGIVLFLKFFYKIGLMEMRRLFYTVWKPLRS